MAEVKDSGQVAKLRKPFQACFSSSQQQIEPQDSYTSTCVCPTTKCCTSSSSSQDLLTADKGHVAKVQLHNASDLGQDMDATSMDSSLNTPRLTTNGKFDQGTGKPCPDDNLCPSPAKPIHHQPSTLRPPPETITTSQAPSQVDLDTPSELLQTICTLPAQEAPALALDPLTPHSPTKPSIQALTKVNIFAAARCDSLPEAIANLPTAPSLPNIAPSRCMSLPPPCTRLEVPAHGSHLCQGGRSSMEDAAFTVSYAAGEGLAHTLGLQGSLLVAGVLDGHNGDEAVIYLRENMPSQLEAVAQSLADQGLPVTQEAVLSGAFHAMEDHLVKGRHAGAVSGSTALVTLVAPMDGTVVVASVGDCRAVASAVGASGHPTARALTVDHRPADNADEAQRLADAGVSVDTAGYISHPMAVEVGCEQQTQGCEALQLSRSLGDAHFKAAHGNTLLATPQVSTHVLTADVQFLVLATDGVWDKLRPNEAAKTVRQALEGRVGMEADAARCLVQAARRQQGPDDNAAVVVVRLATIAKRVSRFNRGPAQQ